MEIRCPQCFSTYDSSLGMCPGCGYCEGDEPQDGFLLKPGTELFNGKYVVGGMINQGGFGIVYRAWDVILERVVAVKEFYPCRLVTRSEGRKSVTVYSGKREEYESYLREFWNEAKIMSFIGQNSDNCIDTYDIFEENGTAYIVMEYCPNPTLKQYVKDRKKNPLSEEEIKEIITQILRGVSAIHEKGYIHLDIAPDNIFVSGSAEEGFEVLIYDFGAARKNVKNAVDEKDIVLKPGFAPPEQYKKNGKLGTWTDVYATGAVLYWMLTGSVPEEATDREKEDTMAEPAQYDMISPLVNNITMRMMALNTDIRYQDAKIVLEEFNKDKVRSYNEELKRLRRNRTVFVTLISAVLLVAAAVIGFTYYLKSDVRPDTITMWVAAEESQKETEEEWYKAVVERFNAKEEYKDIKVKIVVLTNDELNSKFLRAEKGNRPDIVETTSEYYGVLSECEDLGSLIDENSGAFCKGLASKIKRYSSKSVPLGMTVDVVYKAAEQNIESLKEMSIEDFVNNPSGYAAASTEDYFALLENESLRGKYDIVEAEDAKIQLKECFSIYNRGINKKKAATALLNYFLTDAAQDELHISKKSGYMPVTGNEFGEYVNVYKSLNFIQDKVDSYKIAK